MEAECQPEGPITRDRGTGPGRTGARWTGRGKAKEEEWEKEKKRMGKGKEKGRRGETRFTQSINPTIQQSQSTTSISQHPAIPFPSRFLGEATIVANLQHRRVLVRSLGYHINLHLSLSRLLTTSPTTTPTTTLATTLVSSLLSPSRRPATPPCDLPSLLPSTPTVHQPAETIPWTDARQGSLSLSQTNVLRTLHWHYLSTKH
jgi:hypothetical protein